MILTLLQSLFPLEPSAHTVAESPAKAEPASRLSIFEGYIGVLVIAFLVSLICTPIMRRMAVANGVIDRPSESRKVHRMPIAYLGGVAVYLGILAGIFYSYVAVKTDNLLIQWHPTKFLSMEGIHAPVPLSILLGLTVIMLVGVIDDVSGISPRVKIGGQLIAAAALAVDNVGVQLAAGLMLPVARTIGIPIAMHQGYETVLLNIPLPLGIPGIDHIPIDFVYWVGTGIIAFSVLGLCNASNLIDGLDGLLSGTTAITAAGLLVVSLGLALVDDGMRDAQRIVLCLALLGACLGFLPHNFNPATIFLGDAGSLMLGFCTCAIILTLGDTGKTWIVLAGLIMYALPIMDTALAIVRRKMEGKAISAADDQHLHHMIKRATGGVKSAVFSLYAIAAMFATLGASITLLRARFVYVLTLMLAAFIGVIAIKVARKKSIEAAAAAFDAARAAREAAQQPAMEPAGSKT
ncbi:MAG: undecaprenyl/decaprenyl-phosphate alpha-N-acetylglucosaminyl 1-phosphate transferase [Planctomycetes bacterium]|nr:undecaprenyl/decaprenyl-phosphate alpha-N-acetylglucosaminyl 1-phosphate transferase [Planctomycetota bacterium]